MFMGEGKRTQRARGSCKPTGYREDKGVKASVLPRSFILSFAIILGFGLFRGVNSNLYLSAFASVEVPFLFVPDLFFNVVVACSVIVCALAIVVMVIRGRLKPLSMPYLLPVVLMVAGNVCALLGAFRELPSDLALLLPGLLFGVSSTMLSLVWIEVFACQRPTAIVKQIALGMLVSVVTSSTLTALESRIQMLVACVLLAVMAACIAYVRRVMKAAVQESTAVESSVPIGLLSAKTASGEPPAGRVRPSSVFRVPSALNPAGNGSYRDALLELGDSLIAFCVLEAVIGLLNSFMLAGSIGFAGSSTVSVSGMLIGIVSFCVVVFVAQRIPKASTVFRVVMPIIASLLVFLPFLGEGYNLFFSTVLLGSYYFIALLVTYVVAEVAYEHNVSSYVLMATVRAIPRFCLAIALVGGFAIGSAPEGLLGEGSSTMRYLAIIVAVIYVSSLAVVLVSRDRRRKRKMQEPAEDGAGDSSREEAVVGAGSTGGEASSSGDDDRAFDRRCERIAQRNALTERESEILGYLARGRTNVYIAGMLFVSENTVRSHVRNIYAKLDVHTRQELIDLVEAEAEWTADTEEKRASNR